MKKKTGAESFEITIEKLVYGGAGMAHHNGKVVFVPFAVPGDRLIVRSIEEKKSFIRASIVRITNPGPGRIQAPCEHFTRCGGCHWQQLEYARQVEAKRQILEELFHHRFPQTREISISMRPCSHPFGYRSRARLQLQGAGERAAIGFFRSGSHSIEDIEKCPLFRNSLNKALEALRQFKTEMDTESRPQEVDLACSEEEETWTISRTDSPAEEEITPLLGAGRNGAILSKKVGHFIYDVTASAFFQANDFVVAELTELVQHLAQTAKSDRALDLFAGVGLFSLPLAKLFARVVAVENSRIAVRLCSRNAANSGIRNLEVVCADVSAWLKFQQDSSFDFVVLDPPRAGAGTEVMRRISHLSPKAILYISCDPQTLTRDLAAVTPQEYKISLVEGWDMFPQTYHFETVVFLEKL